MTFRSIFQGAERVKEGSRATIESATCRTYIVNSGMLTFAPYGIVIIDVVSFISNKEQKMILMMLNDCLYTCVYTKVIKFFIYFFHNFNR